MENLSRFNSPAPAASATKPAKTKAKPKEKAAPAAEPPAASKSVRDSYEAIPPAERMAIQSDLVWTGDFNGLVNGEFSDRLVAAVKAFQKRSKSKETGTLTPPERAALTAAAKPKQDEVGWRHTEDPVTGMRLGVPGKFATQSALGATGTRWFSQQGQLQIETFVVKGASLETAYEQQKAARAGRRVTYHVLRPDFFVVSGMQGLKKFYVRASARDSEVRGLSIAYDQAMEGEMEPVVVAMSSAFLPFPASGLAAAPGMRRKIEYGTGIVVSATGHVLTDRLLVDGCNTIVVPGLGNAERIAEERTSDLALLRLYGAAGLQPVAIADESQGALKLTLVGIADPQAQAGGGVVSSVTAQAATAEAGRARALDPMPAAGFSGAAAFDASGKLAGMVELHATVTSGPVAGVNPAVLIPSEPIRRFLRTHHVAPVAQPASDPKASVLRVICVRK